MIKHDLILIKKKTGSKGKCDKCHKLTRIRKLVSISGYNVCGRCKRSKQNEDIGMPSQGSISLQEALDKEYFVCINTVKGIARAGHLSLPMCLMGKRVKLTLVENK